MSKTFSLPSLVTVALVCIFTLGMFTVTSKQAAEAQSANVCPGGDKVIDGSGWIKLDESTTPTAGNGTVTWTADSATYTAPAGFIVERACAKGGEDTNPNGYLVNSDQNGIVHTCDYLQGGGNPPTDQNLGKILFAGIDTPTASVTRETLLKAGCAEISHVAFKVSRLPDASPSPTPTPSPSPTPTPTPSPSPSPTPGVTPTPTPDPSPTPSPSPQASPSPSPSTKPTDSDDSSSSSDSKKSVGGISTPTTSGQVLGVSTYAATGMSREFANDLLGLAGLMLIAVGGYSYVYKATLRTK